MDTLWQKMVQSTSRDNVLQQNKGVIGKTTPMKHCECDDVILQYSKKDLQGYFVPNLLMFLTYFIMQCCTCNPQLSDNVIQFPLLLFCSRPLL